MRTTKGQLRAFRDEFIKWRDAFGLQQYELSFRLARLDNAHASVVADWAAGLAEVTLDTGAGEDKTRYALHECLYLLTAELRARAGDRFTTEAELEAAEEHLVRRLECVLRKIP